MASATPEGKVGERPARDHALDALRTLAVLGMMAAHTSRLIILEARPAWSFWVLLLEPIIPSLFLLLVGFSLARSIDAARGRGIAPRAWYARQVKRAAVLWVIAAIFFVAELGFRLPDALLASGILANIAYAILIVGGLLLIPRRTLALAAAFIATAALFVWLDAGGRRVYPVNIGNAPFLPLWLFTLGGALWGTLFGRGLYGIRTTHPSATLRDHASSLQRWVGICLGILAGLIGIWLIARHGTAPLFTKPLGRSDAGRTVAAALFGASGSGTPLHLAYYNLRPVLALCCFGLQLGALTALGFLLRRLPEAAAARLFALGRHALGAYILHLALLAVLVVTKGLQPLKAGWQGTSVWVGLVVICMIWAIWMDRRRGKREKHHFAAP